MEAQTGPEFNPEIDKVIPFPQGDGEETDEEKARKKNAHDVFWSYAMEIMDPMPEMALASLLVEVMGDDYDKAYLKLLAAERAANVDAYLSKIIENEQKEQRKAREAQRFAESEERNEGDRERRKAYQEGKQRRASELTPLQVQQEALALMLKFKVPPSYIALPFKATADLFPNCKPIIEPMLEVDPQIYGMENIRAAIADRKEVPKIERKLLWYADNCAPPDIENQSDAIDRIREILIRLRAGSNNSQNNSQASPSTERKPAPKPEKKSPKPGEIRTHEQAERIKGDRSMEWFTKVVKSGQLTKPEIAVLAVIFAHISGGEKGTGLPLSAFCLRTATIRPP